MRPLVFLEKMNEDSKLLAFQFNRAFQSLSIVNDLNNSNAIFIKPNLTYPIYKKGVTTRKEFIESLISSLKEINSEIRIYIGEGEGGYNSFSINKAFMNMGYFELEKRFSKVKIVNLSKIPSREIEIATMQGFYKILLPEIFFNEIDFSISCPVPKVHCITKVSLSYKNQWGCLPDVMRLKNHYMFDHIISKISDLLKFKYAFLDGKYGLNGNGPIVGNCVEVNWFVASNSLGAFDVIVSEMMGFEWRKVGHLKMAAEYGFIPRREEIKVIGEIETLKRKYILRRNIWNYLALVAFHSKEITHLFYFSPISRPLRKFMYSVRKGPIEFRQQA